MLIDYFDELPYKVVINQNCSVSNPKKRLEPTDFKSLAGFAIKIGVSRDTMHQWSKVHPEFSDAYSKAKDFQENYLLVNGLRGLINAPFAVFTAKNVLGWRERNIAETHSNLEELTNEELEKKIGEHLKLLKNG